MQCPWLTLLPIIIIFLPAQKRGSEKHSRKDSKYVQARSIQICKYTCKSVLIENSKHNRFPSACQEWKETDKGGRNTTFYYSFLFPYHGRKHKTNTNLLHSGQHPETAEVSSYCLHLSAKAGNSLPFASWELFRRYHLIEGSISMPTCGIT